MSFSNRPQESLNTPGTSMHAMFPKDMGGMELGTYLRTWATVLGPYHWPIDLPSPTPICAAGNRSD